MRTRIVKIGNAHGVCIPERFIKQLGFERDIEIHVENNKLIVSRAVKSRANWDASFKAMAERGDDKLLDGRERAGTAWNEGEWEWE